MAVNANVVPNTFILGDAVTISFVWYDDGNPPVTQPTSYELTGNDGLNVTLAGTETSYTYVPTIGSTYGDGSHHTSYLLKAIYAGGQHNYSFGTRIYVTPSLSLNLSHTNNAITIPFTIDLGESINVTWSGTGDYTGVSCAQLSGVYQKSGSVVVTPTETTTYTFVANHSGPPPSSQITSRLTDTISKSVIVIAPPTIAFSAYPVTIAPGQSSTLSWNASGNVTSVTIDQGIGAVSEAGSITVSPTQSTTYTAVVVGPAGQNSAQASVGVTTPTSLSISGPSTVEWGAASVPINITAGNSPGIILYASYDGVAKPPYSIPNSSGSVGLYPWNYIPDWSTEVDYITMVFTCGNAQYTMGLTVNIDKTPDAVNIPTSTGIPNEEFISPSIPVELQDFNVPLEVKSDHPIKIQIDGGDWEDVREI